MTSTVLDVTVLLLCVSASVVALGGAGGETGTSGPTADDAADRLVTETVTVRYRTPEAANGTRTVHATRAELLALLVADAGSSDGGPDAAGNHGDVEGNTFRSRASKAVAAGIDERTRIDARIPAAGNERTVSIGAEPPPNADVATAVVAHPAPSAAGVDDPVRIVVRRW